MSDNVIIIRYGEVYLKGKNFSYFENILKDNIRAKLDGIDCSLYFGRGRYVVKEYDISDEDEIIRRLKQVFGLHSLSIAKRCGYDIDEIATKCVEMSPDNGTFRITTHRSYKKYPLDSMQMNRALGEKVIAAKQNLSVDLHSPDYNLQVDIRDGGDVYLYDNSISCAGGMPSGTGGHGLLLLSGGIDSPVAGYMLAKRGMRLTALHFHSYPYTSEAAKDKAITLAHKLKNYCPYLNMKCVSLTKIQETIHKNCKPNYMITLVRRFMMRIAERVAKSNDCGCIINGESLGQVASQTLESITVTNAVVSIPVFRPLIGMDKDEIIDIAQKIDTFNTSIEPFEDCCTVFLPDYPLIKPEIAKVEEQESRIENYNELIDDALSAMEIVELNY
ncbi:MAG: tRNA 4-thiouridine(8) synthase ThiI [Clostridiales bacterium]|nr:tRNA 4-thiouridine(8) synthase ThiI [Clostridiales bacterium]